MQRRIQALGRLKQGSMNKTELAYEQQLRILLLAGEIVWYKFEAINLRLADKTFYKPDFFVMLADGTLEVHEVKGYWADDAKVKIKVAAEMYPFRFIAVKQKGGKFAIEEFWLIFPWGGGR